MTVSDLPHEVHARIYALVPCAGVGTRSGQSGPKQYAKVAGRPVVAHTLLALHAVKRIHRTCVVISPTDHRFHQEVTGFTGLVPRVGGETRADTVRQGLAALIEAGAEAHDWVLVHDAARCLVRPEWINQLIDHCLHDDVGGILALPVPDTLKYGARDVGTDRISRTVSRDHVWQAQTPQMFRIGLLQEALNAADHRITDESSAVEALGLNPKLVMGHLENFKVTYPADFDLAERLLSTRHLYQGGQTPMAEPAPGDLPETHDDVTPSTQFKSTWF